MTRKQSFPPPPTTNSPSRPDPAESMRAYGAFRVAQHQAYLALPPEVRYRRSAEVKLSYVIGAEEARRKAWGDPPDWQRPELPRMPLPAARPDTGNPLLRLLAPRHAAALTLARTTAWMAAREEAAGAWYVTAHREIETWEAQRVATDKVRRETVERNRWASKMWLAEVLLVVEDEWVEGLPAWVLLAWHL